MAQGTWRKLLDNPADYQRVVLIFEGAIEASLASHPLQHLTHAEVKRRFGICAGIFEVLRGDMKWSLARVSDHMTEFLKKELDGIAWKPSARSSWARGDDAMQMAAGAVLEPGSAEDFAEDDERAARDERRILLPGDPGFTTLN